MHIMYADKDTYCICRYIICVFVYVCHGMCMTMNVHVCTVQTGAGRVLREVWELDWPWS